MTEFVYHVDENDNVIGKVTRAESDKKRLWHRAASTMVFNPKGELLVTKRSMKKKKFPGFYEIKTAGALDYGEEYEEAAIRELKEEVGIIADRLQPLFKLKMDNDIERLHVWIFRYVHDGEIKIDHDEVDEYKWMTPKQVDDLIANGKVDYGSKIDWKKYNEKSTGTR